MMLDYFKQILLIKDGGILQVEQVQRQTYQYLGKKFSKIFVL